MLIRIEVHSPGDDAVFHGLQGRRAFGDDDDVCAVLARHRLTETPGRQQLVIDNQPVIVYEQDVDAGFDITVLEGIVEQDDVKVLVIVCQQVNAPTAVLVDGYRYLREFLLHLIRLVTDFRHGRLGRGQHKALALALIAATEYGHTELVFQQSDEVLYMWRLSRSANGDIAN